MIPVTEASEVVPSAGLAQPGVPGLFLGGAHEETGYSRDGGNWSGVPSSASGYQS